MGDAGVEVLAQQAMLAHACEKQQSMPGLHAMPTLQAKSTLEGERQQEREQAGEQLASACSGLKRVVASSVVSVLRF